MAATGLKLKAVHEDRLYRHANAFQDLEPCIYEIDRLAYLHPHAFPRGSSRCTLPNNPPVIDRRAKCNAWRRRLDCLFARTWGAS